MKKIVSLVLSFFLMFTFLNTSVLANKKNINEQFKELQDKVTDVLTILDNHYVYSEKEVINIIKNEKFDFNEFNKFNNTNYTEDSFIELALYNIKNADLSIHYTGDEICTYGTYCGRNYETSGWNYYRSFNNKSRTNAWIKQLQGAINAALLGQISTIIIPNPAGVALNVAFTVSSVYNEGLKDALAAKNTRSCGTVTDINKFYAAYTVWSQEEFVE